ncbi:MAG: hypothetical protein HYV09_26495 [Deltaproteobacteria bacterium]|nr:hypothetical protein [Deltaproteobacteria bacterium]
MVDRDLYLTLRVSEEEREMLRALAERDGVSASDFVRLHIRRTYREAFGDKPAKKSRK